MGEHRKRAILTILLLFVSPSLLGSQCGGNPYEQEVEERSGSIEILLSDDQNSCSGYYDYYGYSEDAGTSALCLPVLYFSPPADSFQIVSPDGTVLEAVCYSANCMERFTCASCYESTVWEETDAGDYGYPEVDCRISASVRSQYDSKSCTNRFTITAETTDGKTGTVTFVNYYGYDDPDWWL